MCHEELSTHTDSGHPPVDDPPTVARVVRQLTAGLACVLAVVAIPFIFAGASGHDVRWLMCGLTLFALAGMSAVVSVHAHLSLQRGRQEGGRYVVLKDAEAEMKDALAELKGMMASVNTRIDGLEAGQRHIIRAFETRVQEDEGEGDENGGDVSQIRRR